MKKQPQKALFLDRDGVINEDTGYVASRDEFVFIEGIFDLCRMAESLGYFIIIVTNQSGIGRGYYTEAQFLELTTWMENCFARRSINVRKTYHCPYHEHATVKEYKVANHPWRKPNPGMLLAAQEEFNLDLSASCMIGDRESDVLCAIAAGVGTICFVGQSQSLSEEILSYLGATTSIYENVNAVTENAHLFLSNERATVQ